VPAPTGDLGVVPEGADPETYDRLRRRVLWSMPTGLYVVGSRVGERANLMTCNLVMQVSTTPKLVAAAIESGSLTRTLVEEGGAFAVCVLDRRDRGLVRRFVKPVDRVEVDAAGSLTALQGEPVHEVTGGLPVLDVSLAWLACRVRQVVDPGSGTGTPASHRLFLGEVVDAGEASHRTGPSEAPEPEGGGVLRMEDTRMSYGG
jgi:flavin reductase (DIM6/NTAB) family NADH-FMN oxidoreductase RutF